MTNLAFLADIASLPEACNAQRAATGIERWRDAADRAGIATFATALAGDERGARLLAAIFGNSPFLGHCVVRDAGFFQRLIEAGPAICLDAVAADLDITDPDQATVMRRLRVARRRAALAIAVADIAGAWPIDRVTGALSEFADAAIGHAVAHVLSAAAQAGELRVANRDDPQAGSGLTVLALGKLGAGELNYSSDIDIMVLYDTEVVPFSGRGEIQASFVRMTRSLVRVLQERTADGYVFRTDLRLRPDPGATPVAMSVRAAETYYESLGQNWERAAMIKARPVAGDRVVGAAFVATLAPFIWRKNLDFAAIRDIHSIKRQIHAHHGGDAIAVNGHNIKLGRGGIREIEFFAQTQQLIWGGRDVTLRLRATRDALNALAAAGRIEPDVADALNAAYRYLRRVEHRLQMIDDQQTQTIPSEPNEVAALATFLGYADAPAFAAELTERLELVERHYVTLFEESPELAPVGNLVFTGTDDDPDTLATLHELGFADGRAVGAVVRGWHHGRFRAMRSTRAREILTELMPALLGAFAKTANPDGALLRFNEFLARLPSGVQLFSLFHANPGLLDLVAEILGSAPRLAERLSHDAALLDGVLSADFYDAMPPVDELTADLELALARARDYEDVLDISRRWAHEREFLVGVQMLRGDETGDHAGAALADIADAVLRALAPRVAEAFAEVHGRVPGGGLAVIGMGNLGGREMTVVSDLDLILLYHNPEGHEASDGAKPLPTSQYFMRLSQRLINALSALTSEGRLYEIDMRLRPSGQKGPVASEVESFIRYQNEEAWSWEHLAFTRARVVCGPPALVARIEQAIRDVLTRPRDADRLVVAVADMRRRIAEEHPMELTWRTKYQRGGLVDLEFISGYLQLRHAAEHPGVLAANRIEAFENLAAAGVLEAGEAATLIAAAWLQRRMRGMLRLTIGGSRVESHAPEALRALLARSGDAEDFDALRTKLETAQAEVRALYAHLIDAPAAAAQPPDVG